MRERNGLQKILETHRRVSVSERGKEEGCIELRLFSHKTCVRERERRGRSERRREGGVKE